MRTYGELTEQEQEQFCSNLLVLTKNSVSEILGSDYPIYDKTPAQILKDIKKRGEWFVDLPYSESQSRMATLLAEWCKAVEVFNKEFDAVLAKAIKLSWNYNN